jgi:hypothetical protein
MLEKIRRLAAFALLALFTLMFASDLILHGYNPASIQGLIAVSIFILLAFISELPPEDREKYFGIKEEKE